MCEMADECEIAEVARGEEKNLKTEILFPFKWFSLFFSEGGKAALGLWLQEVSDRSSWGPPLSGIFARTGNWAHGGGEKRSTETLFGLRGGSVVCYESIKRKVKIRPIYECRFDERLKTKAEESTRLTYTGFLGEL